MQYETYDKIYDSLDMMKFTAGTFVPAPAMLKRIKDDDSRLMFLMWVEDTGTETEENAQARREIRQTVKDSLVVTDS